MNKFVIATGGTGGHIFPAFILAQELKARGHECMIIGDKRLLNFISQIPQGLAYKVVNSSTMNGGALKKLVSLVKIGLGFLSSLWILFFYKPQILISFGGYVSFPAMAAAVFLRVPVLAHEQNAVIGKTNKILIRWIKALSIVFPNTKCPDVIDKSKIFLTPNPIKASILKIGQNKYPQPKNKIFLLILGGSQGSKILSEIVPNAVLNLPTSTRKKIEIFQQCRKEDVEKVKNFYRGHGIKATISIFFDDLPAKLSKAHLVICRSGAGTVCEILGAHRPAIFIPLPSSADNHQYLNAQNVNRLKAASWIMEEKSLTMQNLSTLLAKLIMNPEILVQAHNNSRMNNDKLDLVDSGKGLSNLVEELAQDL